MPVSTLTWTLPISPAADAATATPSALAQLVSVGVNFNEMISLKSSVSRAPRSRIGSRNPACRSRRASPMRATAAPRAPALTAAWATAAAPMPYACAFTTAVTPWRGAAAACNAWTLAAMLSRSTSIQQSIEASLIGHNSCTHDGYATGRVRRSVTAQGRQRRRVVLALVHHRHPPIRAGGLLRASRRHHGHSAVRLQLVGKHAGRARPAFQSDGPQERVL